MVKMVTFMLFIFTTVFTICYIVCFICYKAGVSNLQDLMPDNLRWS